MKFVTQDYYEILNVSPGATNEEVKRAYRLVRQSFRPDSMAIHSLYAPEETEAISAKIDEAFRILSDPELARRYAKYHRSAGPGVQVPRDPDVFFDLVHDLDGPSPIEQLARQVGRLSEVRRQAEDRVAEEPVPVALRSLPPEPRYNPSPVPTVPMPDVASPLPEQPMLIGDPVDTTSGRRDASVPPAPPMSLFDEPVVARASVLIDIDSHYEEEIESISVLAQVSIEEDDDDDVIISFDAAPSEAIESLSASAFLTPMPAQPSTLVATGAPRAPRAPASDPRVTRPAAHAGQDPSLLPLPGAQVMAAPRAQVTTVEPIWGLESAAESVRTPERPRAAAPVRTPEPVLVAEAPQAVEPVRAPTVPRVAEAPRAVQPPRAVAVSPGMTSDAPSAAPTAEPPVASPYVTEEKPTAGSLALARRASSGPRRWARGSIRKRTLGPLKVEPLSRDVLESIEMDCGGMNGAFLQAARRELEVSVEDISERTKISVMMLRYMEADDIDELPAKVYLKGYLTQVARLLKLPVNEFVKGYFEANSIP